MHRNTNLSEFGAILGLAGMAAAIIVPVAAWITHIIWIIGSLASQAGPTAGQMLLGGIGAFMPPVGVIHGIMIWLGVGL